MSEPPSTTRRKSAERAGREERLAKALRDNLRRRKEQARARDRLAEAPPEPRAEAPDREPEPPP